MVRANNYQSDDTEVFCRAVLLEIKGTLNTIKSNFGPVLRGHDYLLGILENKVLSLHEISKTVLWGRFFWGEGH